MDKFIVPTYSMLPTLIPGDRIIVNKQIIGARIYDDFDFGEGVPMKSHRVGGHRSVEHNDIVVFNFPLNRKKDKIEWEINYVYAKRCIGMPSDTVSIVDGYFKNSNYSGDLGVLEFQERLSSTPDSLLPDKSLYTRNFKNSTIKNFAPLYIPRRNDTIALNRDNFKLYKRVIEFETSKVLNFNYRDNMLRLGDNEINNYTFEKDYYFLCGDNVIDSNDSRYWGFVPEEYIVGVVSRIVYSRDRETNEFRWDRFMKSVMN